MVDVLNTVLVLANLVLIYFVFRQVRLAYKPLITTAVISGEKARKDVFIRPDVLESGVLYLVVSNISKNTASNMKIRCEISLKGKDEKLDEEDKALDYLNPGETTAEPMYFAKNLLDKRADLFEKKVTAERAELMIPKETLWLILNVTVTYGFRLWKHKVRDSYEVEWGSLKSYPNIKDHPILWSWNKRGRQYIYKWGEKKKDDEPDLR